ncbi:MAG TPA: hypothetical protein VJ044_02830, partial [Candidatus Hodarchaeales archaeon]|nr:hypothetical protein [Candidatus Hodarchaeales archaeon]
MSEKPRRIIPILDYLSELNREYSNLKYRMEILRQWFYREEEIFFDSTEKQSEENALEAVLTRRDFTSFTVFFIVKNGDGGYELMSSSFKNLGGKTISNFANTFRVNLEFMTR